MTTKAYTKTDHLTDQIIYCDGTYEVHPGATREGAPNGRWVVVNSETGDLRSTHDDQQDAVASARALNAR